MITLSDKRGSTSLFYVEDSTEVRSIIERELAEIDGVEVLGYAERALEAIREIRRCQPDLVVLDLQLLEGTGIDVLKGLRGNSRLPVFIMLSNNADTTSREHSLKAGASYFFDKSNEFEQFLSTVQHFNETILAGRGTGPGVQERPRRGCHPHPPHGQYPPIMWDNVPLGHCANR